MKPLSWFSGKKNLGQPDPWKEKEIVHTYVARFREAFEKFAEELSKTGLPVRVRPNSKQVCIEVYFECGIVLFQVNVHGCMGSPYEAVITAIALTEGMKDEIRKIFLPLTRVYFVHPWISQNQK